MRNDNPTPLAFTALSVLLMTLHFPVAAATGQFDPATGLIDLPRVDLRQGTDSTLVQAQLRLKPDNTVELISAGVAKNSAEPAVTFDIDLGLTHIPVIQHKASGEEFYVKLRVIPGIAPLTFMIEHISPTLFSACPAFSQTGETSGSCILSGEIKQDITLTANTLWVLDGIVFIGGDNMDSATLTINPGTRIVGEQMGGLYIRRGSKIQATGTPNQPIIMTGKQEQMAGEWIGLSIAGNAPLYDCLNNSQPCESYHEALATESVGGTDPNDNSGALKYLHIKYSGQVLRPAQGLTFNGLDLQGVGRDTLIDFIHIDHAAYHASHIAGGTVQLQHIVMTEFGDAGLRWSAGWNGKAQFMVIKPGEYGADGIEGSAYRHSLNPDPADTLSSQPVLANITALGGPENFDGIRLKTGTRLYLSNSVFSGFPGYCLKADHNQDSKTPFPDALRDNLRISHTFFDCEQNFFEHDNLLFSIADFVTAMPGNSTTDPKLNGFYPNDDSLLLSVDTASKDDPLLKPAFYSGAFRDKNDRWMDEWTADVIAPKVKPF